MKTTSITVCAILVSFFSSLIVIDAESSESAGIVVDDTFNAQSITLEGPTFNILESYGQKSGVNLFHSFEHFNLKMDETANFTGAASIQNIISRVTGGNMSSIDGTISSEIQGANFYFLNPAGIMFGPNASLDISGSFYVSTGDYVRGTNETQKFGNTPESTVFMDDPAAFGFLDKDKYGSIQFDGFGEITSEYWDSKGGGSAGLAVETGKSISLIGGDIEFLKGTYFDDESYYFKNLEAKEGIINIASVASVGEVLLDAENSDVKIGDITSEKWGNIRMFDKANLDVSGENKSGTIIIKGGQIYLNSAIISSKNCGDDAGGNIEIRGDNIILSNQTNISVDVVTKYENGTEISETGDGGHIILTGRNNTHAESITLIRSQLYAGTYSQNVNAGKAGNINVKAKNISLLTSYQITDETFKQYEAHLPQEVYSRLASIKNVDFATKEAFQGKLSTLLTIEQWQAYGTVIMEYVSFLGSSASSIASGTGQGGNIFFNALESVTISGKSSIAANAMFEEEGAGSAGNIEVDARTITLSGTVDEEGNIHGGISSQSIGPGAGGNVTLSADESITLAEFATISTDAQKTGAAGNILLNAKNISILKGGIIKSSSGGTGKAGNITLHASQGTVQISGSDTNGDSSSIRNRSQNTEENAGDGGKVSIYAKNIWLIDGGFIGSETYGGGDGGLVELVAENNIHFWGTDSAGYASKIYTTSMKLDGSPDEVGKAGDIKMNAHEILLEDGAGATASTLGPGAGGKVFVEASRVELVGGNPHGENDDGFASGLFARSEGKGMVAGDADLIEVKAAELIIRDGAVISNSTLGAGNGGELNLNITDKLVISGQAKTEPEQTLLQSQINFDRLNPNNEKDYRSGVYSRSESAEPYAGNAGTIIISSPNITIEDHATISTATKGGGDAGNVELTVKELAIKKSATLSSATFSTSNIHTFYVDNLSEADQLPLHEGDVVIIKTNDGETYNYYRGDTFQGIDRWKTFTNLFESQRLTFRIYTVNSEIDLNYIIPERGDIGKVIDSNTQEVTYYIYRGGWNKKTVELTPENIPEIYKNEEILDFSYEQGDLSRYVYIDEGLDKQYTYDGNQWKALNNTADISDIILKSGLASTNPDMFVITDDRTKVVERSLLNGDTWIRYQYGGDAGSVNILKNENLTLSNNLTQINTATYGGGNAGIISILSQNIQLYDRGEISSASHSDGNGGMAGRILLGNDDNKVQLISIDTSAQVSTSTEGLGKAGNIEISAEQINLKTTGTIASSSNSLGESGDAGTIMIKTDTLSLMDLGTTINTSTSGQGVAGNILISAKSLQLDQKASISSASNSIGKGGNAGKISIGQGLELNNNGEMVLSDAADEIQLSNQSTISTSSAGVGKAGNVTLKAKAIHIRQASSVSSANSSVAEIIYTVDTLNDRNDLNPSVGMVVEVSDAGDGKTHTYIYTGLAWEEKSQLSLNRVETMDQLNSLSATPGDTAKVTDAGEGFSKNFIYTGQNWVEIVSDKTIQVYVANDINDPDLQDAEKGDIVEIVNTQGDLLDTYIFDSENWVKTQWNDILDNQTAKAFQVDSLSDINTQRITDGDRADVSENNQLTHYIRISNAWKKISKAGDAGKIDIEAEDEVTLYTGGSLNTEAISSGGGQISIHGKKSLYLLNGLITASVQKGFGKGGDITTRSKSVLMNHSGIEANAVEGDGGAIFITTEQYIKSDESSVTATSERGNDGTVKIDAPKVDISKGLVILPTNFLDATKWVKTPCAQRSGASVSRLVVEGRDAVPTALVDWQPSPPSDLKVSDKPSKNKKSSKLNHPTLLGPKNKVAMKSY
ncbi:secreted protein containing Filamentous hemagglutinin [Candidatus Magnetomorum sp. HK-1]|nr:secreted protein containing Filamentous hemagglutinin [Candidatus Magnetomorum sp. HK-1]